MNVWDFTLIVGWLALWLLVLSLGAWLDHVERKRPHPARDLRDVYKDPEPRGTERLRKARGE